MHMSIIMPTEFDKTLDVNSKTVSAPCDFCERTKMIASLKMNMPPAANRVHLIDDAVSLFFESRPILGKILDAPTTHQPRISVVITVETACIAYGLRMNCSRIDAPNVPSKYPTILATMMMAAVNSMSRFLRKHTSKTIVIVSKVSNSSSSMPAILQLRATTACRTAKKWIIHVGFILECVGISFVF